MTHFPWDPRPISTHRRHANSAVIRILKPGVAPDLRNVFDFEIGLRLMVCAYQFPAGVRLRVDVQTAPGRLLGVPDADLLVQAVQLFDLIRPDCWPRSLRVNEYHQHPIDGFRASLFGGIVPRHNRARAQEKPHATSEGPERLEVRPGAAQAQ